MAHRPNILALATKIAMESMTYTGITYNDPGVPHSGAHHR